MHPEPCLSFLIAEGDSLTRAGLATILHEGLPHSTIEQVTSFDSVVATLCTEGKQPIVLIGTDLLGETPAHRIEALRTRFPHIRVVVLSRQMSRELILTLLSVGTHGCVPLDLGPDDMIIAFRSIAAGQLYVPPILSEVDTTGVRLTRSKTGPAEELTERQLQVLELMAAGNSNKHIARQLGIAEGTVKVHMNAAFRVLGVHNRVSAVAALRDLSRGASPREPVLPGFSQPRRRVGDALLAAGLVFAVIVARAGELSTAVA